MPLLAVELWQQICFASSIKSLKSLRLVNHDFAEIAARALFEEVYVAVFLEDSLSNLQHIAAHPTLCKNVVKLSCLDETMAEFRDYEDWRSFIDLRDVGWTLPFEATRVAAPEEWDSYLTIVLHDDIIPLEHCGSIRRLVVSEEFLKNCYQNYVRLCSEHGNIMSGNLDIRKTVLAIPQLLNLQSIRIYDSSGKANKLLDVLVGMEESPIPFLSRLQQVTLLQDPFESFHMHQVDVSSGRIARALASQISALSRLDQSSRVQELDIDGVPWCFWQPDLSISYWDYYRFLVPNAFHSVRIMKVCFHIGDSGENAPDSSCVHRQIISFLSACSQVEVLNFAFYYFNDWLSTGGEFVDYIHTAEIFRQCTWSNLKWLKVSSCGMSEVIFLDFMRRHSQRLRTFIAHNIQMTGPSNSWRHAIETIAPVMILTTVQVKGLQDEELKKSGMLTGDNPGCRASARQRIYHAGVSEYLKLGGKRNYPIWGEIDGPISTSQ